MSMGEPELLPELRVRGVCGAAAGRASVAEAGAALQRLPLHALGFDLASAVVRRAAAMHADDDRAEVRARLAALLPPGLALAAVRYELDADGGVLGGCASAECSRSSSDGRSYSSSNVFGPVTPELLREAARVARLRPFGGRAGIELAVDGVGVVRLAVYSRDSGDAGDAAGRCRITHVEDVVGSVVYVDGLARLRVSSRPRVEHTSRYEAARPRLHDDAATMPLPWLPECTLPLLPQGDDNLWRLNNLLLALAYPLYQVARDACFDIEIDEQCPSRNAAHRAFFCERASDPALDSVNREFLDVVRATVAGLRDRLTARLM
jgi:hypothetical protein